MRLTSYVVAVLAALLLAVEPAFAAEGSAVVAGEYTKAVLGFGLGIAAFGGAISQAKIISSALDAIARNPGASGAMFLPWILGVVFVETLVIYVLLIAGGILG